MAQASLVARTTEKPPVKTLDEQAIGPRFRERSLGRLGITWASVVLEGAVQRAEFGRRDHRADDGLLVGGAGEGPGRIDLLVGALAAQDDSIDVANERLGAPPDEPRERLREPAPESAMGSANHADSRLYRNWQTR